MKVLRWLGTVGQEYVLRLQLQARGRAFRNFYFGHRPAPAASSEAADPCRASRFDLRVMAAGTLLHRAGSESERPPLEVWGTSGEALEAGGVPALVY